MPRMVRLEGPGLISHIIARGIDGKNLFYSNEDRHEFLSRLDTLLRHLGYRCITWCLMDNHYHLLLRTNENSLEKLMRPLNGGYARWFNKKHNRKGYLFQDRFKSILCQDQEYAMQLIRYINLNPLRAGDVESLSALTNWPWCGHGFLAGRPLVFGLHFQDRMEALGRFGRNEKEAIRKYLGYVAEGVNTDRIDSAGLLSRNEEFEIAGSFKGWPSVIGDPEFARKAMVRHRQISILRKHRQADYQFVLDTLSKELCAKYKIKEGELLSRGRLNAHSEARAVFAFRAHSEELLPLGIIAYYLRITISPTVRLVQKGKNLIQEIKSLRVKG